MTRDDNIHTATTVKVTPSSHVGSKTLVPLERDTGPDGQPQVYFVFQKRKFLYNPEKKQFEKIKLHVPTEPKELLKMRGYDTPIILDAATHRFGPNRFDIPLPSFLYLYREQALAPFFVFQVFCVLLWSLEEYVFYCLFTLFMLLTFEATVVKSRLRNLISLREMSSKPSYPIHVFRLGVWKEIDTTQILPGDIVSIGRGATEAKSTAPCDLLLLSGGCVVNESMLTGESTPHHKESVNDRSSSAPVDFKNDKIHIIFGGTQIVQHNTAERLSKVSKPPDRGCIAYALKTGFDTNQGRLMRTIWFSSERVTANNKESFLFIIFLLIFAIAASIYLFLKGMEQHERSKYKLLLHCIMVITSVVPPELPMELSLAVNNSLISLVRLGIYCTEPFRIPFAGKVDIVTYLLAGCHSLVVVDNKLVGDPMETASVRAIPWNCRGDVSSHQRAKLVIEIVHRFHFSSELKRMATIANVSNDGNITSYAFAKGAPEVLKPLFAQKSLPTNYDELYKRHSRQGSRVLALGYKRVPTETPSSIKHVTRESMECELEFGGFLIFDCPLKPDSREAIDKLIHANHHIVMITGDNSLTACHVASQLGMMARPTTLVLSATGTWTSVDETLEIALEPTNESHITNLIKDYNLAVSGASLPLLLPNNVHSRHLHLVNVFARVSPEQKQMILTNFKDHGHHTLMAGDGTNDVGALKQAHVGVAILNKGDLQPPPIQNPRQMLKQYQQRPQNAAELAKKLQEDMKENELQMVKLGDASIAAPFTSKSSRVIPVTHIIRQGRCTLVTTHQMYKILALNSLISAYSLSVLYLDGVKLGDTQVTLAGMLIAICFLFISTSKPLEKLAAQRPNPNLFSPYMMLSILLQFVLHLGCLIFIVNEADQRTVGNKPKVDSTFAPSLVNSAVFLISNAMQVATFAINYKGHPFMQSLRENRPLLYALSGVWMLGIILSLEILPSWNEYLELIPFPDSTFRLLMFGTIVVDLVGAWVIEKLCDKFLN
eukprot:gene4288-5007_t